ncbi:MAG TPA: hypothetical protein VIS48_07670 [Candidatus Kryptonia bacterium]
MSKFRGEAFVRAIAVAGMAIYSLSCSTTAPKTASLAAPKFVPQSQPDSIAETGIGQDVTTGGIYLQWYIVPDAAGYKLFRADTSDPGGNPLGFSIVANVSVASSLSDTSVVDNASLTTDKKYFYYLRSYLSDGSMSDPSDTINYTLWPRSALNLPQNHAFIDSGDANLKWIDYAAGGFTVIRMTDMAVFPNKYIWITPRFQSFGGTFTIRFFDFDGSATSRLISHHSYQWRVDRFNTDQTGRPYIGSRSTSFTFTVN